MTGVKMSWVTLDRIVSKEALSDQAIRRQLEQNTRPLRSHAASMGDEALLAKLRGLGERPNAQLKTWRTRISKRPAAGVSE